MFVLSSALDSVIINVYTRTYMLIPNGQADYSIIHIKLLKLKIVILFLLCLVV